MFHVETTNQGVRYFLRSTTWTSEQERASTFNSAEEARAALEKARKFMKPAAYRAARVVQAEG